MKRFVFSLDPLFEVKKKLQEKAQAEYAEAREALEQARRARSSLEQLLESERGIYEARARRGITVSDMEAYNAYFEELEGLRREAERTLHRAQEELRRKQTALVEVFKEIKVLEKLRQKQYKEYLAEAEKQETNVREDILSYQITRQVIR